MHCILLAGIPLEFLFHYAFRVIAFCFLASNPSSYFIIPLGSLHFACLHLLGIPVSLSLWGNGIFFLYPLEVLVLLSLRSHCISLSRIPLGFLFYYPFRVISFHLHPLGVPVSLSLRGHCISLFCIPSEFIFHYLLRFIAFCFLASPWGSCFIIHSGSLNFAC